MSDEQSSDFITDTDEIIAAAVDPALIRESLDLDAIQALADSATPGPWKFVEHLHVVMTETGDLVEGISNAEFIAQARTLVPALIAELREIRDELARWVESA